MNENPDARWTEDLQNHHTELEQVDGGSRKVSMKMGALRFFIFREHLEGIADKAVGKKKIAIRWNLVS